MERRIAERSLTVAAQRMSEKIDVTLTINGRDHAIRVEARKTLVDAIREDCGQTGTHIGCEHGICGTCTVILDDTVVRSCLMFAVQAQGRKIRTVEGLAVGEELHPLQRAFITHHGLQCGFCTPGFLMLAANTLEQNPDIGDEDLLDILSSNLCRCTGYQNIIKAVRAAAIEMRGALSAPRAAAVGSEPEGRLSFRQQGEVPEPAGDQEI
jgi:aerobic carbon-monoxide dehydrogenase small subunit